jgi:L-malate glycosyltransferase
VLFVGRLSPEKNPDVFIDSAKQILKNNPSQKIKFFIIGDGIMRSDIEKEISKIDSDIKYLGYQKNIAKYLSLADVFVLPSSVEGFPLSILEAMSMNLAVIASNVGAIPDVLNHRKDGFIVEPGNSLDITKIINELNDDRMLLNKVKKAARLKVVKLYSNISLKNNYKKLYEDLTK